MRNRGLLWFAAALALAIPYHGASAAPQVLAALPSDGVPFACADGYCQADLSTYCLQRYRPAPERGTAYTPATPDTFMLVVTTADGTLRRLPAADYVAFEKGRGFTAVTARIPEDVFSHLGAVDARIEVGANASLLPQPQAGDPDPLTAEEIAATVGPLRALGTEVVDASPRANVARILSTVINTLPAEGRVGSERLAEVGIGAIEAGGAAAEPGVLSMARAEVEGCVAAIAEQRTFNMRQCLEISHDQLMRELTIDYWNANVGS